MNWAEFYLICFIVGFALTAVSFLAGAVDLHLPFHLHFSFHGAHADGGDAGHGGGDGADSISWFNASTAMAFLAWFGGVGYLLTRHSHLAVLASLAISTLAGLAAGWMIFKFMAKLTQVTDPPLNNEDFRIEGSLGKISMPIRENGTGEIIFTLAGVRRCAGARTADGRALEKGEEVVIERYEKGIAYVKKWEEFVK